MGWDGKENDDAERRLVQKVAAVMRELTLLFSCWYSVYLWTPGEAGLPFQLAKLAYIAINSS